MSSQSDAAHASLGQSCSAADARSALAPIGARREGSSVAVAALAGRPVALLADEDDHAVQVVDLERNTVLSRTDVGGAPAQLLVLSDGRVLVTVQDQNRLAVMEAGASGALSLRCNAETGVEPVGIAATPDESKVVVTNRTARTLTVFAGKTMGRIADVETARDPYSVAVSRDGRAAFVSHVAGSHITVASLDGLPAAREIVVESKADRRQLRQVRDVEASLVASGSTPIESVHTLAERQASVIHRKSVQGFAIAASAKLDRLYAPMDLVDSGDEKQRTTGYGSGGEPSELPAVAVLDAKSGAPFASSLVTETNTGWSRSIVGEPLAPCLLPRASVVDDEHQTLLVACVGIDHVIAFDASSAAPASAEVWRTRVPSGPTGLAIDPARGRVVVWSSFDRVLSTIPLVPVKEGRTDIRRTLVIPSSPAHALPAEVALGRLLFHASGDPRVSADGRGCASCHPSGRDDGLVWSTPRGPRRTRLLAGMLADTAPYSWDGVTPDLPAHVEQAFQRLHGQGGLRSFERRALVRYLESLPLPPSRREEFTLVDQGRKVFASAEAGCANCHAEARLTDGVRHDVSSRTDADAPEAFDTPSLRRVASRAPYFHDGRYPTLEALIAGADGNMGKTKHLSADDKNALVAYLRSL